MDKILVPTDFSKQSGYAADFACALSQNNEVGITLLHAVEYPLGAAGDEFGMSISYDQEFFDLMIQKGKKNLAEFAKQFQNCDHKEVTKFGNPYQSITETVSEEDTDLIIMGTKGASGLTEVFIGSNAERVVRQAKCPVITLAAPVKPDDIKEIVYATDLLDPTEKLVSKIKQLQDMFDATIHVVRVNTPTDFKRDSLSKERLQKIVDRFMLKDYTINVYNDLYEEDGILAFAEKIDADMIAIGTHGRRGLGHWAFGSLAEDVVNHSKFPVWTYHLGN